jgi:hypothetical protein
VVDTDSDYSNSLGFGLWLGGLSDRILPYIIIAIIVYVLAVQLRVNAFYRRGELTYWQIWVLSTSIALVVIACLLLRDFILVFF